MQIKAINYSRMMFFQNFVLNADSVFFERCLPKYVVSDRGAYGSVDPSSGRAYFDHAALHKTTKIVTRNLNRIIDINKYPIPGAKTSNQRHRPIGLGVSGLADTFIRLGLPFTCEQAKELNEAIFETMYHAALEASVELAEAEGHYETFTNSPASKGQFQFDMWNIPAASLPSKRKKALEGFFGKYPERFEQHGYDWEKLRGSMMKHGLRNSLLLAPMPTASTSQILGVNECFEPFSSNLYLRRVKAGEFIMANPHLLQDLTDRGLWTPEVRNELMRDGGSVANIDGIPSHLKEVYKTVWEIKMKNIIDMAADRGKFIDQSQSLNLFIADPNMDKLTAMHFYAWKKGLKVRAWKRNSLLATICSSRICYLAKQPYQTLYQTLYQTISQTPQTGMYYLRTKPAVNAIQYTVEKNSPSLSSVQIIDDSNICESCQA